MILTRYLYFKEDVLCSLFFSILNKEKDKALFWAYELYYSGFQKETIEYLDSIYKQCFWVFNPKLEKPIQYWLSKGHTDVLMIGHCVVNLCSPNRKYNLSDFLVHRIPSEVKDVANESRLIIKCKESDIEPYYTCDHSTTPHWKILPLVCAHRPYFEWAKFMNCEHCQYSPDDWKHIQTHDWLYYASFSPIWQERILEYGGFVVDETKKIEFEDEEKMQEFYRNYGYEPDEQSSSTLFKFLHHSPEYKTQQDFITEYKVPCKKVKIRNKLKINTII